MNFSDLKKQVLRLSSSEISDAMDYLNIPNGALPAIKPLTFKMKTFGVAFTVLYEDNKTEHVQKAGDYIDEVTEEHVIVIDNHGKTTCTVWGGLLSAVARLKNIQGTIINGVCRDVNEILDLNYPVFSLGYYMVTGKGRGHLSSVNTPLTISGVTITEKDYVFADCNGVLIIPGNSIQRIIEVASEIKSTEEKIISSVKEGKIGLKESRAKYHYNKYGKGK